VVEGWQSRTVAQRVREALGSYQQALAALALLPESPDRDSRELGLRQSTVSMLSATNGYAASETIKAIEQALSLAEKSGNVTELANWLTSRASAVLVSGDLAVAGALADRVLQLALPAQRTAIKLGEVHQVQIITRYFRGDLAGSEKHFAAWGEFFSDGRLRPPIGIAVNTLAFASFNAWVLGQAELARERERRMLAAGKQGSPFDVANSEYCGALLEVYMRDYERAEAMAAHALELAKKHQLPNPAARAQGSLGLALAHLGRDRGCIVDSPEHS
jgi:hypothetical protein